MNFTSIPWWFRWIGFRVYFVLRIELIFCGWPVFFTIVSILYWSSISNNTHHHVHISFDIPNEYISIKWISFYYSKSESRPDGIPGISRRRKSVTVSNIPNWTCMHLCVCVCLFISSLFGSRNLFMQIHQCKTILFTFSPVLCANQTKQTKRNESIHLSKTKYGVHWLTTNIVEMNRSSHSLLATIQWNYFFILRFNNFLRQDFSLT